MTENTAHEIYPGQGGRHLSEATVAVGRLLREHPELRDRITYYTAHACGEITLNLQAVATPQELRDAIAWFREPLEIQGDQIRYGQTHVRAYGVWDGFHIQVMGWVDQVVVPHPQAPTSPYFLGGGAQ